MVDFSALHKDINDEISTILASDFQITVTKTALVPHSDDTAITFPNLDQKSQGTKVIETTVLYVDMRRSTALSMKHKPQTVAKLYSAFVRGVAHCAKAFGGEIRGIIGDRVMIIFHEEDCYTKAVDTAVLINSVCTYVINRHFTHNEVAFGIGIDHGNMLATKTGVYRRGSAQQSYRSLVWLGKPANIASKLTDAANKPAEYMMLDKVRVAFANGLAGTRYEDHWPNDFTKQFYFNVQTGQMHHVNPTFMSFSNFQENCLIKEAAPSILMTKKVYDGFRSARPKAMSIEKGWLTLQTVKVPEYSGDIYGGDVIYSIFQNKQPASQFAAA